MALDPTLPDVIADPQQIRQILGILIENAVESIGPDGGTVTVTSEHWPDLPEEEVAQGLWEGGIPTGPLVRLSVSDTGGGVGPAVMTRLFDPFFSTKALGRGLGLSSALGLIRGNHAGLQVLNRPGEGMTFRIHFAVERRAEPSVQAPVSPVSRESRAVLVVDDEPVLRQVLAEAIGECYGCKVFEAADGLEAIEVFRAHRDEIGLVLIDCVMPRMRGPEAFDEMRRIRPGIPGILMSGFSDEIGVELVGRHGFATLLKKPFPFKVLSNLMAQLKFGANGPGSPQDPPS
jgi:CheY-like chemotaxis protein